MVAVLVVLVVVVLVTTAVAAATAAQLRVTIDVGHCPIGGDTVAWRRLVRGAVTTGGRAGGSNGVEWPLVAGVQTTLDETQQYLEEVGNAIVSCKKKAQAKCQMTSFK